MSDDVETRLRDGLRRAQLPAAPEAVHEYVASLRGHPLPDGRRRPRPWVALVPVAAVLVGIIALAGGSSKPPTPPVAPSPSDTSATFSPNPAPSVAATFPPTVDGLPVRSVSELLAARAAGETPGGPYALGGYWTDRNFAHMCAPPHGGQPGELELYCHDGEWGITERDEPIKDLTIQRQANETSIGGPSASGPHLTPWVPSIPEMQPLFALNYGNGQFQFWSPVPIVVVGHFDDPRAAECRKSARQLCLDRFVVDRVVTFDPNSVPAPTPSPSPTPFPVADPPPALFTTADCYGGVPKSFVGWKLFSDLHIQVDGPGYVYAMVSRDVIPIGDWFDVGRYPGHKTRWWGQGVCYGLDSGGMGFGTVKGTGFLEVDDGRHIAGDGP